MIELILGIATGILCLVLLGIGICQVIYYQNAYISLCHALGKSSSGPHQDILLRAYEAKRALDRASRKVSLDDSFSEETQLCEP